MTQNKLRLLKHTKRNGSIFPSEVAGYRDPLFSRLVKGGYGYEVDEQGRRIDAPLADDAVVVDSAAAAAAQGKADVGGYKFNLTTDPFVTDGITEKASRALHEKGLHTVDDVRSFLAGGGKLSEIHGLHVTQEEKIVKLYGTAS